MIQNTTKGQKTTDGVKKYVYFFGNGKAEGTKDQKDFLGGKGANLAEMTNLGIPVPPGFTISTVACKEFYTLDKKWPPSLEAEIQKNLKALELVSGKNFGSKDDPLLVSVRSGAAVSMPGMMDTILNLGLNDATVQGLIKKSGNERFAYDAYRRFIQMFGNVVLGMEHRGFEQLLAAKKKKLKVTEDTKLDAKALKELVVEYKAHVKRVTKKSFPEEPMNQLRLACNAVFASWNNPRAITYRNLSKISHELGTAVNVQTMVFGNMGDTSGTGVAFTRDPGTGEHKFFGEFLINAQGEDVVAGIRTPSPISQLKEKMPQAYALLETIYQKLEQHFKDMQDLEFTIEDKRLFLLQTRNGKRSAGAAVKIACDMVKEGLITKEQAILRVAPEQLDQLLHPTIDPKIKLKTLAKGLPASPGAAVGRVVFNAEDAISWVELKSRHVVLVRRETSPEDVGGMAIAEGILTATGGMTSHAAVVARGMGKCCIAGCSDIQIDDQGKYFTVQSGTGFIKVREGDVITLNGSTGEVILGEVKLVRPELGAEFKEFMRWADEIRRLKIRTNADTPDDAQTARAFGAEGIGLCRTEHMFFGENRLKIVREMILAENEKERIAALKKLKPLQRADFREIFKAMAGLPVTIRLLDPPLHEFLPKGDSELKKVAKDMRISVKTLQQKVSALHEVNPMLGHRGCRLAVTYPEIYRMQAEAIFEAACELGKENLRVVPEVMIPLVGMLSELTFTKQDVIKVAEEVMKRCKTKVNYLVGTMIEIPRAAVIADALAKEAEFFSFGTNDLTQMTFGFSRDDAGKFLPSYIEKGLLKIDPFVSLDQIGVGRLIEMAVSKGRRVKQNLKVGICGEHGGDPASIEFCHRAQLDYVSCSPFRVPIARLAAAQAVLKEKQKS
ncbi:MAG: pyruvate, phosphate dikinase [Candidatus Omnitrophica bacterium CG1_02_49_16]|nr:MAG: pyruvate, phosphate dikinase [Candidatus Omnitrophica bacterium CG1_02_49_16]